MDFNEVLILRIFWITVEEMKLLDNKVMDFHEVLILRIFWSTVEEMKLVG